MLSRTANRIANRGLTTRISREPLVFFLPQRYMDRVYENIYISSLEGANTPQHIKNNKIECILSRVDMPISEEVLEMVKERKIISFRDSPWETVPFKEINEVLSGWRHKNILVHCYAGISRAVTAVAGFVIFKGGKDVKKILKDIKDKRPCARPNYGFVIQLYSLIPRCPARLPSR